MKYVIEAFSILFTLMAGLYGSVLVISVSGQIAAAKEYKADVIAEIENSNFNPSVIAACTSQAEAEGYQLTVSDCTYDALGDLNTAEVILTYEYNLPFFGVSGTRTTRGIAR